MRCSGCGVENPPDGNFCIACGASFKARCSKCGSDNLPQAKFCAQCGTPLRADIPDSLSCVPVGQEPSALTEGQTVEAQGVPEGERKRVTALFADIKGSTELEEKLDPEEARAIVDPVLRLMMEAVHRYGGYVAQSTGDGIFALFGAPLAHHPQRALNAALAIQRAIKEYAASLEAQRRPSVEARVGVNTGEVVVRQIQTSGHTEYTPIGHTSNLGCRRWPRPARSP